MAWKIALIVGGLIGVMLVSAAVLVHPIGGEVQDDPGLYLLVGGLGVLLVTAPTAWLVSEMGRPISELGRSGER